MTLRQAKTPQGILHLGFCGGHVWSRRRQAGVQGQPGSGKGRVRLSLPRCCLSRDAVSPEMLYSSTHGASAPEAPGCPWRRGLHG